VPFDEGSLTGTMTGDMTWPEGDWRNLYFTRDKLAATLARVDEVKQDVPAGMSLPELALRFILASPDVTTVIPGMRRTRTWTPILPPAMACRWPRRLWRDCVAIAGTGHMSCRSNHLRGRLRAGV
jgi:hypothetical protein